MSRKKNAKTKYSHRKNGAVKQAGAVPEQQGEAQAVQTSADTEAAEQPAGAEAVQPTAEAEPEQQPAGAETVHQPADTEAAEQPAGTEPVQPSAEAESAQPSAKSEPLQESAEQIAGQPAEVSQPSEPSSAMAEEEMFLAAGRKRRKMLRILLTIFIIAGVLMSGLCWKMGVFQRSGHDLKQQMTTNPENTAAAKAGTAADTTAATAASTTASAASAVQNDEDEPVTYTNIALLGVDSRKKDLKSGDNRSDIITIVSINNRTKNVKLLSVYRDTYLKVSYDDSYYDKANTAFSLGGGYQTLHMLNTNFDLNITDYVTVGFLAVINSIDAIGGVDVDIQEDEINEMNEHMTYMSKQLKIKDDPITHAGLQHLNGIQATAYCRVRHTAGNDYKRTDRQRLVMKLVLDKIKKGNLGTLIGVASGVLPEIDSSLSWSEILSLLQNFSEYNIVQSNGVPQEDMLYEGYINGAADVIPKDLASNTRWVHKYLYHDLSYQVPMSVLKISDHIASVTGCWYDDPLTTDVNEALQAQQRVSGAIPYTYEAVYGPEESDTAESSYGQTGTNSGTGTP